MSFSCGFFDAENRDRVYTAENFTKYLSSLICNGILDTYGECFKITTHNDLTVTIGTGKAWINGHYFENDESYTLDLGPYVSASQRQYVVVGICCDINKDVRDCFLVVEAGASAPTLSNSDSQTYLTLALVRLEAGTQTIAIKDITDYRDNDKKCGYVKCILGKCGISELMEQLATLKKKISALERQVGLTGGVSNQRVIAYPTAAIGLPAMVDSMGGKVTGLMGIIGSLETIKTEDE